MPPLAGVAGALAGGALAGGTGAAIGGTLAGALPSLFGGGGSSQQPNTYTYGGNPASYIPTAQPAADVAYQNIAGFGQGQGGGLAVPYSQFPQTNPALGGYQTAQDLFNQAQNPVDNYLLNTALPPQAMAGAQNAADYWTGQLFPALSGMPVNLAGYGSAAAGLLPTLLNNAQNPAYGNLVTEASTNPYYNQALSGARSGAGIGGAAAGQAGTASQFLNQLAPGLAGLGSQYGNQIAGAAQPLQGAGSAILQTGFDPQAALYSQLRQQTMDAINAQNAASGVASTPYGASVTGNVMGNLGINWQNQQLQRQAQALQSAGANQAQIANIYGAALDAPLSAAGTAGNLLGQGFNLGSGGSQLAGQAGAMPSNAYMANLAGVLPYLQATSNAGVQGAGALANLLGGIGGAGTNALNLGQGLTQGTAAAGLMPFSTAAAIGQTQLGALNNLQNQMLIPGANLGMQAFQLPQQGLADLATYFGIAQPAQAAGLQGGQMGFNQGLAQAQGLGQLAGLGSNMLFGNQGLGGALGINPQTGLLGNWFGGGGQPYGGSYDPTVNQDFSGGITA